MSDYTREQIDAAGRELMAVTLCGPGPEHDKDRDGFRRQWNRGGFKDQKDHWRARALAVLQAAEPMSVSRETPALGQRVLITRTLRRHHSLQWRNTWEAEDPYVPTGIIGPVPGIIVGVRTLSDGRVTYNGEDGTTYTPDRHFTAYLVSYDLRRSPVYALPEHTIIKEES